MKFDRRLTDEIYTSDTVRLGKNAFQAMQETICHNGGVGTITGYYDAELSILSVSDLLLHNLNHSYASLMEQTKGSLKNLFYKKDAAFLDNARFRQLQGEGEGRILTADGAPVYVRLYKKDAVDTDGTPIWIMSVQMNWAYPIAEIAEILDKGSTTIKGALNELDTAGLLERERGGFSAPNRLYVKVPRVPQVQFSDQLMAGNPTLIEPENRPTDGQKTDLMMVGKPSPNQTTINNLTESQTKGVSGEPPAPYGRYQNIFLSQTEYDELQAEYPDRLERFIEEMSRYLAANGKSYQNYAAALRIWAGNDKKKAPKKGIPDYSCKEGESL